MFAPSIGRHLEADVDPPEAVGSGQRIHHNRPEVYQPAFAGNGGQRLPGGYVAGRLCPEITHLPAHVLSAGNIIGWKRNASLDTIADLIGSVDGLPTDLSAQKKAYLRTTGYGQKRPR